MEARALREKEGGSTMISYRASLFASGIGAPFFLAPSVGRAPARHVALGDWARALTGPGRTRLAVRATNAAC
jgi:hypothetical protein